MIFIIIPIQTEYVKLIIVPVKKYSVFSLFRSSALTIVFAVNIIAKAV